MLAFTSCVINPSKVTNMNILLFLFLWPVGMCFFMLLEGIGQMIVAPPLVVHGMASYYDPVLEGRTMANGSAYNAKAFVCASWDFPLGTRLLVISSNRSCVVTVADRGPAKHLKKYGRVIDLSEAAFFSLSPLSAGLVSVSVQKLPSSMEKKVSHE